MTAVPVPSCMTCASCVIPASGRPIEATCAKVVEPIEGRPLLVKIARMAEYNGWALPCQYDGKLWSAKS